MIGMILIGIDLSIFLYGIIFFYYQTLWNHVKWYTIQGNLSRQVSVTSTSQTEYTAAGLTAGLSYRFQVKAVRWVSDQEADMAPESDEQFLRW